MLCMYRNTNNASIKISDYDNVVKINREKSFALSDIISTR